MTDYTWLNMKVIKKIALAVFKDKKMLQVRSKKQDMAFFTLGGKVEEGEDDLACIKREVREEVGCEIDEASLKFLTEFEDVAHGKKDRLLNVRLYEGKLKGVPKPCSEISEIGYFDTNSPPENLSLIAKRTIFPWLKKNGFIN